MYVSLFLFLSLEQNNPLAFVTAGTTRVLVNSFTCQYCHDIYITILQQIEVVLFILFYFVVVVVFIRAN